MRCEKFSLVLQQRTPSVCLLDLQQFLDRLMSQDRRWGAGAGGDAAARCPICEPGRETGICGSLCYVGLGAVLSCSASPRASRELWLFANCTLHSTLTVPPPPEDHEDGATLVLSKACTVSILPRPWEDSQSPGYHVSPWSPPSPSLDGSTAAPSGPQHLHQTARGSHHHSCHWPEMRGTIAWTNVLVTEQSLSALTGSSPKGYEKCNSSFQELPHGHKVYLWLVWSGTLNHPLCCKTPRRLIQAGELRPTASLIPKEPRWQVWEDSLPSSLQSQAFPPKSQGENSSLPEAYHNSGPLPSPPGPVALSEACPFPTEETHPGHSDQYPRGHRD